jgi:hypothetical protein
MGRPPNVTSRTVVEDCEIVNVSDALRCFRLGLLFTTVARRGRGRRFCLLCPRCSRRAFKLYKPVHMQVFACRSCHNLSYTSVQKHDARLDRLLRVPDATLLQLLAQRKNVTWRLLAARAAYIRLGLLNKC